MPNEPWDRPSEKLKKIAGLEPTPNMRICEPAGCGHRHPKGRMCGAQSLDGRRFCKCEK